MTELSFLVDLLLNHKLPKITRDAVAVRIKEVELALPMAHTMRASQPHSQPIASMPAHIAANPLFASQSPSTQALLAKHPDLLAGMTGQQQGQVEMPPIPPQDIAPVTVVAQTPMAVAAISSRVQAIQSGISGKPLTGETRPRKW